MKIAINTNHEESLAAWTAAGHPFPTIPAGKNTVWHLFEHEGRPAVIINQLGFTPLQSDDEQEVNGCSLVIAIDAPDPETGRVSLEKWVREFLEVE